MPLGIKPTVDFAFKKIFGSPENRPALIGLLNAILTPARPIESVEILNPFSYQEFAEDKLIVLDIRARDSQGRWLNIEMQISVVAGLIRRLVYYGCSLYVDQLQAGGNYSDLCPAISICLLREVLFRETPVAHHRFQLADVEHGRTLDETIEVHTVELTKYNVDEATLGRASEIEKWVFFLLHADEYDADRLRALLPEEPFQRAIGAAEAIAARTEDRMMYDRREKAQRDYQWALESARREGLEKGLEKGREEGREEGVRIGLEKGREKGLAEGREEGVLIGKIQLLEQLLGQPPTPTDRLSHRPLAELNLLLAQLQERLRRRGA
ncbi:MAG: Rpn family recombination-promoting nuclease/putative transposase [Planctomycetes bacterium]|nr:Rpn family recombination-promoting nuclease/putative transposase [Planctomycetota bacterium]